MRNTPDFVYQRKEICRGCEMNTKTLGIRWCGAMLSGKREGAPKPGCGCIIRIAVRLPGKSCPLGKWGSVLKPPPPGKVEGTEKPGKL